MIFPFWPLQAYLRTTIHITIGCIKQSSGELFKFKNHFIIFFASLKIGLKYQDGTERDNIFHFGFYFWLFFWKKKWLIAFGLHSFLEESKRIRKHRSFQFWNKKRLALCITLLTKGKKFTLHCWNPIDHHFNWKDHYFCRFFDKKCKKVG